jgi:hypothetical protein
VLEDTWTDEYGRVYREVPPTGSAAGQLIWPGRSARS